MRISGRTQLYGVVGDPISHSLSPAIHNQWMRQHKLDAVYIPVNLRSPQPADDLKTMTRLGFKGLNVTLPHKLDAAKAAAEQSDLVKRIGAANTLVRAEQDGWAAHNTDVEGLIGALHRLNGTDLKERIVVLIGAGGAARAAGVALERLGATIRLINRTSERAKDMAAELKLTSVIGELSDLRRFTEDAAVVINSASFGHSGRMELNLPPGEGRLFLDLSYGAAARTTLQAASTAGWTAHDGLFMLVYQAAAAFRLWFNLEPDTEEAMAICRSAMS